MHIAIVGAGEMGTEIAQAAILGTDEIILHDIDDRILRMTLGQISRGLDQGVARGKIDPLDARRAKRGFRLTTDLADCADADLIIEAVHDDLEVKQALFQALDEIAPPPTVLASTAHTLPMTTLAAATRLPQRVVGLHFFNPVYVMQLVEVVRGPQTSQDSIDDAVALMRQIDKIPVVVEDTPGLIVNRVSQAYYGEALRLLDGGKLEIETVDRLMEAAGFPMGPFRLMDFVGVDTTLQITQMIYDMTFHTAPYQPHARQQRLVDAERLGRNSRRGGWYPRPPA
jgi:3-hydroxybutyryl-CoA dehydrogenase